MNNNFLIFELDKARAENERMREALSQAISACTAALNAPVVARLAPEQPKAMQMSTVTKVAPGEHKVSCADIIEITLDHLWDIGEGDFRIEQILSKRRDAPLVEARHKCMIAVRDARPDMSISEIAREFKRDHTTVLYALKKHDAKVVQLRRDAA